MSTLVKAYVLSEVRDEPNHSFIATRKIVEFTREQFAKQKASWSDILMPGGIIKSLPVRLVDGLHVTEK
ncbi:MAG: hypothetical protein ACW99U_12980 [Candidatus Thorarchaeota archaeon]|jgi:hypothetical protein